MFVSGFLHQTACDEGHSPGSSLVHAGFTRTVGKVGGLATVFSTILHSKYYIYSVHTY